MADESKADEKPIPPGMAGDQPDFDEEDLEIADSVWDRIAAEKEAEAAAREPRNPRRQRRPRG